MAEGSSTKSSAELVLEKIYYTKELIQELKASEKTILEAQSSLPGLKDKQWWIKHKVRNLMSYHEFLSQLLKSPDQYMTNEEVAQKTSGILEEYHKEKKEHKDLLDKCRRLSCTLQDVEEISKSGEDIQSHIMEMKEKAEKRDVNKESKSTVFEGICETAEGADNAIKDLKAEIKQQQEINALLEKRMGVDEEEIVCAENLLKSVEKQFDSDAIASQESEEDLIETLTARLQSEK